MVPTVQGRTAAVAATAIAAVALLVAGAATVFGAVDGQPLSVKAVLMAAVWVVPGVLIASARPRTALGWLALGEALLFAVAALAGQWVRHAADGGGADVAWAAWLADRFSALLAVGIWLVLVLLPDGRLPSRGWRPLVSAVVAAQFLVLLAFFTLRGPAATRDTSLPSHASSVANPVGMLPSELAPLVDVLGWFVLQLPLLLCLAAYVVRLRRSEPDERTRIVGVLLAGATSVLVLVVGHASWPQVAEALHVAVAVLLASVLTAAVLERRPRVLVSVVRLVFVHTVLVLLVGGAAGLATAVLHAHGQQLPAFGIAALAGVIALMVQPLRTRLGRVVDLLLYGDVHDPYRALQRLADQTHRAPTVDSVLSGLAATVAASLRVPWTAVEAGGHVGSWGGRPTGGEEAVTDLVSGSIPVGTLSVACGPGRRLTGEERRLLGDLGRHGGVAVQAVLLTEALRTSRQRLVVAREEERRRLRRDLHDGVGPTLAGLTMQLGAVRSLVHAEPDIAADRLDRLEEAARDALVTVRRISHDLRPPALDELGLAGALRQLAESLGLRACFSSPEPERLPAAVEVAAYLIAAEALHNVSRHAGTTEVAVDLRVEDDEVTLSVRDGGRGVTGPAGVGLPAMRERADELGGQLLVETRPGQGTTITARLPARESQPEARALG